MKQIQNGSTKWHWIIHIRTICMAAYGKLFIYRNLIICMCLFVYDYNLMKMLWVIMMFGVARFMSVPFSLRHHLDSTLVWMSWAITILPKLNCWCVSLSTDSTVCDAAVTLKMPHFDPNFHFRPGEIWSKRLFFIIFYFEHIVLFSKDSFE